MSIIYPIIGSMKTTKLNNYTGPGDHHGHEVTANLFGIALSKDYVQYIVSISYNTKFPNFYVQTLASAPFNDYSNADKAYEETVKAYQGAPTCPLCNKIMVLKNGKVGGFWGCSGYPQCHGLISLNGKPNKYTMNQAKINGKYYSKPVLQQDHKLLVDKPNPEMVGNRAKDIEL